MTWPPRPETTSTSTAARPVVQVKQVILEEMRPMAVDTSRRVDLL